MLGAHQTAKMAFAVVDELDYNLLYHWFVGLSMEDKVGDHAVFSKNQERFLFPDLAAACSRRFNAPAPQAGLLSEEHFAMDGTLIEAWTSMKSFCPQDALSPRPAAAATRKWIFMVNGVGTNPAPPLPTRRGGVQSGANTPPHGRGISLN